MGGQAGQRRLSVAGIVCLAGLLVGACGSGGGGGGAAELSARPIGVEAYLEDGPTTVPAETTPTTAGVTTTAVPLPGLAVGAEGPEVQSLEQKLSTLKYFVGTVDSRYDTNTRDAVMAFQKVTGMDRTGRATDDVLAAVQEAKEPPKPLVAAGGFKRVEVDLDRQVLFLYEGNNLDTILGVSTGNNQRFCSEGWCRRAVTPAGSFVVYEQRKGWEKSPLGWLYNSQYFNGGIAFHGSNSVPGYPASHGCVRLSMSAAEWFPDRISVGTPVYVVSKDEPLPTPIGLSASPVSTPTTIVPDTATAPATTTPAPTTTVPNLLSQLLAPPTTARP